MLVPRPLLLLLLPLLGTGLLLRGPLHTTARRAAPRQVWAQKEGGGDAEPFNLLFTESLEECQGRVCAFEPGSKVPAWLKGSLIRNGPGLFQAGGRRYTHLFDGMAKLTKYTFGGSGGDSSSVEFSAAFLRSEWFKRARGSDGELPPSITTGPVEPPWSAWENFQALLTSQQFDNVPVNIHQMGGPGGPWAAVTDAPVALEFSTADLSTKGRIKYASPVTGRGGVELFSTAHPATDSQGRTLNYFLELNPVSGNTAHIVRIDPQLQRTVVGSVPVGPIGIPYVHDISVTENYAILAVWPIRISNAALFNGRGFLPQLEWCPKEQPESKIYVFDLRASTATAGAAPVATFTAPAIFSYHHINAYEQKGSVVLDVSGYSDAAIVNGPHAFAYLDNCKDAETRRKQARDGRWMRFELPVGDVVGGRVEVKELRAVDAHGQHFTSELVTINPKFAGKRHRYSYGFTGFAGQGPDAGGFTDWAIVKLDHDGGSSEAATVKVWKEAGSYPSEPIMVPRAAGASDDGDSEDVGVVLSQVFDSKKRESFLLVLDAKTMQELGRAYLGLVCPVSFHGAWIDQV